jgi:hypothetical protein
MTQFQDYQPREHWTLRIPGWRFAIYCGVLYVALCLLMGGCKQSPAQIAGSSDPDVIAHSQYHLTHNGPCLTNPQVHVGTSDEPDAIEYKPVHRN